MTNVVTQYYAESVYQEPLSHVWGVDRHRLLGDQNEKEREREKEREKERRYLWNKLLPRILLAVICSFLFFSFLPSSPFSRLTSRVTVAFFVARARQLVNE